MSDHPLDQLLVPEEELKLWKERDDLEEKLAKEFGIKRFGFQADLIAKLKSGEIEETPDIMRWQSVCSAMLDWAEESMRYDHEDSSRPAVYTVGSQSIG